MNQLPPLPDSLHDVAWDLLPKTALESVITKYGQQCYQAAVDKAAAYIDSRYDPCEPWLTPEDFREHMK